MLLLLGILFCYDICFQEIKISSLVELSSENNLSSNTNSVDLDIIEEDQIIFAQEFFSTVENTIEHVHFHVTCSSAQPFLAVWQPPKLS
ncbi:hypothetical protein [Flavobacterium sp.]